MEFHGTIFECLSVEFEYTFKALNKKIMLSKLKTRIYMVLLLS